MVVLKDVPVTAELLQGINSVAPITDADHFDGRYGPASFRFHGRRTGGSVVFAAAFHDHLASPATMSKNAPTQCLCHRHAFEVGCIDV